MKSGALSLRNQTVSWRTSQVGENVYKQMVSASRRSRSRNVWFLQVIGAEFCDFHWIPVRWHCKNKRFQNTLPKLKKTFVNKGFPRSGNSVLETFVFPMKVERNLVISHEFRSESLEKINVFGTHFPTRRKRLQTKGFRALESGCWKRLISQGNWSGIWSFPKNPALDPLWK